MGKINRYAPEVRDRAIRMVTDHRGEYPSQWAAIQSVSQKLGMTPETLRAWVRRAEIDNGKRDGVTTAEAERIKALEKEVRELRRANEILKDASIFFATELIMLAGIRFPLWYSLSKLWRYTQGAGTVSEPLGYCVPV